MKINKFKNSFAEKYQEYLSAPCLRFLLFMLIIETMFFATTPYGNWRESFYTIIVVLVVVLSDVCLVWSLQNQTSDNHINEYNSFGVVINSNARYSLLGGIIVFVVAILVATILRREILFSAFSMVLYNLLVSFILSLSVIVSINKKELLILVLNAYGLNEKLIRWRSSAWALVIIMCVLECFIGTTNILTVSRILLFGTMQDWFIFRYLSVKLKQ